MVRANWQVKPTPETRKTGHTPPTPEQLHSSSALLVDILKTLEIQLQERGLLPSNKSSAFYPVWFLAETERNIFLWRHGCSLIEQDEFEFWIDVRELVAKRLRSLEKFDPENPFLNPLWGAQSSSSDTLEQERSYLKQFQSVIGSIEEHATALCHVASRVLEELCPLAREREAVLLPPKKR